MAKSVSEYFSLVSFQVNSTNLLNDEYRLNAEYYQENLEITISEDIKFKPLSDFASVIFPGIFKRILVDNTKYGMGFLTTSDMMIIEPIPEKYLSTELTQNLDIYRVTDNTLLVSRSGTIGNTIYVNDDLVNLAITEDALRVSPYDSNLIGLLYFYFISDYGNGLITGKKSGAVIDHIYEDDLLRIPIPVFDNIKIDLFLKHFQLIKRKRELANDLIRKARSLALQYNNLPPLDETEIETLDPNMNVEIRFVSSNEFTTDYRLDAHFYNPTAKRAVDNIVKFAKQNQPMHSIADCSFRGGRSIRNYVDKENGTPFLSGKNIIQIRPDFKYISNTETSNLNDMLVKRNWILISRSGTLGRTVFVYNNYEDFAASEHLIRVLPNENIIDGGYLYAFLSSDYGYHQLLRYKHGAVIDEITEDQISQTIIPLSDLILQREIGDLVRMANDYRAEAIQLEDEAQKILNEALTGK